MKVDMLCVQESRWTSLKLETEGVQRQTRQVVRREGAILVMESISTDERVGVGGDLNRRT